jgi:hypothetical protein
MIEKTAVLSRAAVAADGELKKVIEFWETQRKA